MPTCRRNRVRSIPSPGSSASLDAAGCGHPALQRVRRLLARHTKNRLLQAKQPGLALGQGFLAGRGRVMPLMLTLTFFTLRPVVDSTALVTVSWTALATSTTL